MSDSASPCLIVYSPQPGEPAVTRAATRSGAATVRASRRLRRRVGRVGRWDEVWVLSDIGVDTAVTGVTVVTCEAFVTPSWYYTGVIQPGGAAAWDADPRDRRRRCRTGRAADRPGAARAGVRRPADAAGRRARPALRPAAADQGAAARRDRRHHPRGRLGRAGRRSQAWRPGV